MEQKKVKEYVKILKRKRKNGTYLFLSYYLPNGVRKQKSTNLVLVDGNTPMDKENNRIVKKAIEKQKADLARALLSGKYDIELANTSKQKKRLCDYIEDNTRISQRAVKTQRGYLNLKKHIEEFTPNINISEIDKNWVVSFLSTLSNLKPTSIKLYCTLLSATMRKAVKDKLIPSNPVAELTPEEKPKTKQVKRDYLTPDELEKVVEAFPKRTKQQREGLRMFLFSCYTGLRFSDVVKLQWNDIKKDASNGKSYFVIEMQKTKEIVKGYLSQKALALIERKHNTDENIFWGGAYLSNANKWLKIASASVGIEKNVSFHTARHTFAVNLLAGGMDIYSVSRLLGHTDIKTTQIYLEMMPKKQIEASELIDEIF